FVKTLLNVAFIQNKLKDLNFNVLEVLFGKKVLKEPYGLYFVGNEGDSMNAGDNISIIPLFFNELEDEIGGAFFRFRSYQFYLNIPCSGKFPFHKGIIQASNYHFK